ncbi:cysteine rich repeat-containing protein [Hyphomicrobium sp. CS1GBMeth3]|uniref:cysteine rich repeat-containing protein n=1 Tax=Hyphomicrobium sp. CS1GBMeth3 TaxID=1892845 RepID=UPI000931AB22|nr:cysteine rich repeat-containing protein [Hyphomicrobium sp. CS1GBMeth3]
MRRIIVRSIAAAACAAALVTTAIAQEGLVATACKDDISKFCAGKEHGRGDVRGCLESNKDKLSAACKTALDNTGPGRGMGAGRK